MYWIQFTLVALMGLAIGSFLNVAIHRLPRKIKFRTGRSICPHCGEQLRWYQNVPLLSYLGLRGKCGFCLGRISFRYPLVEALNCGAWLYFFWVYGLTVEGGIYAVLVSALIVVFFIDLDFQIIPDSITLPGMVIGLGLSFVPGGIGIVQSGIGLLVGGVALYLIALLGDWLFKKESMGGGDIKLAAMLGSFLGWQKVLFVFMASAVVGLVASIAIMIVSSRVRETRMIPFGPFIAIAAFVAIAWGDQIITYYVDNFLSIN